MFGAVDVFRMGLGAILFQTFVSYFFTSSAIWGYSGRYSDMSYYKFKIQTFPFGEKNLTRQELRLFNGTDISMPVYISVGGTIYDVSARRALYTPPLGRYSAIAGQECGRMLVTGCLGQKDHLTSSLEGLGPDSDEKLRKWQRYYEVKSYYWTVGHLQEPMSKESPRCKKPMYVPNNLT